MDRWTGGQDTSAPAGILVLCCSGVLALLWFFAMRISGAVIEKKKGGQKDSEEPKAAKLTFKVLAVQGIATSIDALSVGFTISEYSVLQAFASSLIIGVVTLVICLIGLIFGKKIGNKISSVATIIGGAILIFIGIEIFVKGIFGL